MTKSRWFLFARFLAPLAVVVLIFVSISTVDRESDLRAFLLSGWYVQAPNTWLFLIGVWLWAEKGIPIMKSRQLLKHVKIEPHYSEEDMQQLLRSVPPGWPKFLTVKRLVRLLEEVKAEQDPRVLNELLSREDLRWVERGHLVVDSLKGVIPVIGFLGTVLGLSLGMLAFPDVADPAKLRTALSEFSLSLSLAFNTTLLALLYTIILLLLTMVSRESERTFLERLDGVADDLVKTTRKP